MIREPFDWLRRTQRLIPKGDRRVLFSPFRLVARFTRFALARHAGVAGHEPADDLDARDPVLIEAFFDFLRAFGRLYFRPRIEGIDNVPAHGPVLLVGNHNGALLPTDGFLTALAIHDHYGRNRAVYALAHDFLFEDPTLRTYAQRLGMIRANAMGAREAFERGQCVLVYPGSDLETFRPFRDRAKVVLGGRTGFLKLAIRAGVPIVPVVSAGTHEQLIVLTRGDRLARLVHAHAWARTEVCPIVLSLPWGLTSGFVPYLPLPAQVTLAFDAPMVWPDLRPEDADDPRVLARCYADVERRMQATLDRLSEGRRFLIGQPRRVAARSRARAKVTPWGARRQPFEGVPTRELRAPAAR